MNNRRDIKIPDKGLSINPSPKGYSPSEMNMYGNIMGRGKIATATISLEEIKLQKIAMHSRHQVERAMGIDNALPAMWQAGFECYHICYPHPFRDDRLVVDYYGDGRVAFFRMIGDEIDSSIAHIDNWYLTTLRKHLREFYPYKLVTSS